MLVDGIDVKFSTRINQQMVTYRTEKAYSICPYVFSCKMFVKSDFFVYFFLEHSNDEKKRDCIFSNSLNLLKID